MRARVFRVANVPMRMLLGLPFPTPLGRRLLLAEITGRRSGRLYRQPLSYVVDGETMLTPGGGRWTLNLQDGAPVRLRIHGRDLTATPELVENAEDVDRLLGVMADANPALVRFVPIPRGADGHFDPERLGLAVRHGFCVVRWHPQPVQTAAA